MRAAAHRQVLQSNADLLRDDQFLQLKLNYRGASLSQGEPSYKILRQANGPLRENEFIARDEHIWNIYGVASGVVFLIRPDGYIGLIANRESASQVKDYLRKCTRK